MERSGRLGYVGTGRGATPRRQLGELRPTKPARKWLTVSGTVTPLSLYGLTGVVYAKFSWAVIAPPLRISARHSRESGNPVDFQPSPPPEIKYKLQPADPHLPLWACRGRF